MAELSKNAEKVLELVEALTIVELADLVSAMEEKFGVSAAAPVAVMAGGAAPAGADEEKTAFDVVMTSAGGQKIAVIKVIREITGLGLAEAKALADNGGDIKKGVKKLSDECWVKKSRNPQLTEAGAEKIEGGLTIDKIIEALFFIIWLGYLLYTSVWVGLTQPFVIGGEWGTSTLSFNSYLIYFVIANVVVFLLGREIALRDIVPLNMIGLFLWTTTLYALSYRNMQPMSGLQGDTFTLILLTILVIVSVFGIILSSRSFASSEEGYLSVGYLIPLIWHITNVSLIGTDSMMQYIPEATYICIAIAYFYGWSVVKDLKTRYQHSALYTGWAVALVFAFVQLFPDLNFFSSIFIAYIGLIFWLLYYFHSPREERLFAYLLCSIFGGFMWLINFYTEVNIGWNSVWTTIVLIPSLLAFVLIPKVSESKFSKDIKLVLQTTSVVALLTILFTVISDILQFISLDFALFILPACIIIFMASFTKVTPQSASFMLRISMVLIAFWFFSSFIYFVMMLVPGNADGMSLWKGTENFLSNDHTIKALFSIMALSLGLRLSRKIQIETKEDRPSFVLVIFLYSIVLIFVNYLLIVGMNDIGVATGDGATGGPRAIAITFWWAILSIAMMTRGVQWGHMFRSEKLLGLLLLFVTIGKVVLYDLSTMGSTNKVIVLMLVGGGLMLFSYFFHISSWFKNEKQ
jgi:large subunit ribosomal protein L7/L12